MSDDLVKNLLSFFGLCYCSGPDHTGKCACQRNNSLETQFEDGLKFSDVTRLEVIGPGGREYVRYFEDEEFMHYMLQDEDRTLKIFIEDCK